jgi:alkylhydroperoxidase family enzyme
METSRISPVEPPYSTAVRQALDRIMPEGVPPLLLFRVLAANERVFSRVMAAGLLDRGAIPLRARELVIDRTCARLGSEYEWGVHVTFFGAKAGFDELDVAATLADDPAATELPPLEQRLLRLVDELIDTRTVSDELFAELASEWPPAALVELVALVGFYHLIALTTNAFRIPLEPFAARFPERDG